MHEFLASIFMPKIIPLHADYVWVGGGSVGLIVLIIIIVLLLRR
jgi:hypothetical protein